MTKIDLPYPMTNIRRELFMRILNQEPNLHPIAMRLHYLADHFPMDKLDAALAWLCKNNIIGQAFVKWHEQVCIGSDLEMTRQLLMVVENQKIGRLVAGKNFKL